MAQAVKKIDLKVTECTLPRSFRVKRSLVKVEGLFHSVRNTSDGRKRQIISMVNLGDFCSKKLPLSFDLAYFCATQRRRRTLLIDASRDGALVSLITLGSVTVSDHENSGLRVYSLLDTDLYVMRGVPKSRGPLVEFDDVEMLYDSVRDQFDFTVVHCDSPVSTPETVHLTKASEGCVVVIQAEKTRIPVLRNIMEQIEHSGTYVLGTVLDGRKFYIPSFIYNILFRA